MTGKHTLGPWVAKIPERKSKRPSIEIDSARSFVCDVWGCGEEVKANAHLIAAAPDLLAVAKWLEANRHECFIPNPGDVFGEMLFAAIAKAEGRE